MTKGVVAVTAKYNLNSWTALAGALEASGFGGDVHFIEMDKVPDRLPALADTYSTLVVGFSFASPNVPEVSDCLAAIGRPPNVLFVAGGPHPSGDPEGTLDMGFDIVVKGEGEVAFPRLVVAWPPADGELHAIPNLVFRTEDGLTQTPRARPVNLDDYPPLSVRYGWTNRPLEITRGCPHACGFCQTPFLFGGKMRHRSVASIVEHLKRALASPKPPRHVRFVTPDAFAYGTDGRSPNPEAVEELLRAVTALVPEVYYGSFPGEVRPENVSPRMLQLVRRYACNNNIVIGAQSGSARLLEEIHRGHTVEDIRRATRLTLEAGLEPRLDFIFGMPGETAEDRRATRLLMEELTSLGARIHTHYFMPLPGTPLGRKGLGAMDKATRRVVDRLTGKGAAYGQWQKQMAIAQKLAKLRRSAELTPKPQTDKPNLVILSEK